MYNFCHSALKSIAKSECVCSDGYDVQNLIMSEQSNNGFLASYFVKTPVDITIKLFCHVKIRYIVILTRVENQESKGIEITTSENPTSAGSNYKFLSKTINSNLPWIIFSENSIKNLCLPTRKFTNFTNVNFMSNNFNYVNEVKIRIFKASYVAAIKKLEIWGEPCGLNDTELTTMWEKMLIEYNKPTDAIQFRLTNIDNSVPVRLQKEEVHHNFDIPDEFLDEITFEIMTLPIILPSGKVIDKTTLDKWGMVQEAYGKHPADPFTGVLFSQNNKPKVANTLKARIDKFLLLNASKNEVKYIPRRVGLSSENASDKFSVSTLIIKEQELNNVRVKTELPFNIFGKRKCETVNHLNTDITDGKKLKNASPVFQTENLDVLLQQTLVNLPSFLSPPPKARKTFHCNSCNNDKSDLYVLICKHYVCRSCLVNNVCEKKIECYICKCTSQVASITKVHENFKE